MYAQKIIFLYIYLHIYIYIHTDTYIRVNIAYTLLKPLCLLTTL